MWKYLMFTVCVLSLSACTKVTSVRVTVDSEDRVDYEFFRTKVEKIAVLNKFNCDQPLFNDDGQYKIQFGCRGSSNDGFPGFIGIIKNDKTVSINYTEHPMVLHALWPHFSTGHKKMRRILLEEMSKYKDQYPIRVEIDHTDYDQPKEIQIP
jgi:hypothetical protein